MASASLALTLYRGAGYLAVPLLYPLVAWRVRRGKDDPARRHERFGRATAMRPSGPLVWVHAASVGETNAVLPLIRRIAEGGVTVLLTTTTLTAARIAEKRLPDGAIHQFVPFDLVPVIRRFLGYWRPEATLFVESEIWPATLSELASRAVPSVVVNGRLSQRSWRRWRNRRGLAERVFGMIGVALTQTEKDAERFGDVGVARCIATGNLKFDGAPLPDNKPVVEQLCQQIAGRPVWIAASTHAGEEAMIAEAHNRLRARFPDILTIVVPRHPDRGAAVAEIFAAAGITSACRSDAAAIKPSMGAYVADTIGEMGVFYRLAPVAFIGGSLVAFGGHNPIEPAELKAAVIAGTHVENFADVYRAFDEAGALVTVNDAASLADAVRRYLETPDAAAASAVRAEAILENGRGALERTYAALKEILPVSSAVENTP